MKTRGYGFLHDIRHPVLRWGYIFVIPGLVSYFLFTTYPAARAIIQSLHLIRGIRNPWVLAGLENYRQIAADRVFWKALGNTFQYVLMTVPIGTLFSLAVAICLNSIRRFNGFFRALYFIPSIAGVITMGIVFTWIYEPYSGLLNMVLSRLGLPTFGWLRDMKMALPSIAAMTVWRTMGYNVVILLAGLLAIPAEYYESAQIDGAGALRRHLSISLPLVAPTLMFVVINNTILDMQMFSETFVMTGGGPGQATTTVGFRIYQEAFLFFNFGKASGIAVILLVIILLITIVQLRFLESKTRTEY